MSSGNRFTNDHRPFTSQSSTTQPSTRPPFTIQPSTGQPSTGQPSTGQPSTGQSSTNQRPQHGPQSRPGAQFSTISWREYRELRGHHSRSSSIQSGPNLRGPHPEEHDSQTELKTFKADTNPWRLSSGTQIYRPHTHEPESLQHYLTRLAGSQGPAMKAYYLGPSENVIFVSSKRSELEELSLLRFNQDPSGFDWSDKSREPVDYTPAGPWPVWTAVYSINSKFGRIRWKKPIPIRAATSLRDRWEELYRQEKGKLGAGTVTADLIFLRTDQLIFGGKDGQQADTDILQHRMALKSETQNQLLQCIFGHSIFQPPSQSSRDAQIGRWKASQIGSTARHPTTSRSGRSQPSSEASSFPRESEPALTTVPGTYTSAEQSTPSSFTEPVRNSRSQQDPRDSFNAKEKLLLGSSLMDELWGRA